MIVDFPFNDESMTPIPFPFRPLQPFREVISHHVCGLTDIRCIIGLCVLMVRVMMVLVNIEFQS